ncbi:MAG: M15 family metallopeptidase [Bacteriovoracaceae bacterium]|nr:M15 family metallopeptidase [Bacteriovoracaceae bacterium]
MKRFRTDESFYFCHQEVEEPLNELQKNLRAHGIEMEVASGFRSYEQQEKIWNEKVEGIRPILERDEKTVVDINRCSEIEIVEKILYFSAIPGCSRHHWGTDFDFFDPTFYKKNSQKLLLINSEYEPLGPNYPLVSKFEELFQKQHHQFYRPYLIPRGVAREEWHISFRPLADQFMQLFSLEIFLKNLEESNFHLKKIILQRPKYFYKKYFLVS